jgi:hypothetical protein
LVGLASFFLKIWSNDIASKIAIWGLIVGSR